MSRALDLRSRQVTAICRGAAKAGFVAVVKIGDTVIHLMPREDAQAERPIDMSEDAALDAELSAFEAKHGREG